MFKDFKVGIGEGKKWEGEGHKEVYDLYVEAIHLQAL